MTTLVAICPKCIKRVREGMLESIFFRMEIGKTVEIIESEESMCKECLEDEFWIARNKAKNEEEWPKRIKRTRDKLELMDKSW